MKLKQTDSCGLISTDAQTHQYHCFWRSKHQTYLIGCQSKQQQKWKYSKISLWEGRRSHTVVKVWWYYNHLDLPDHLRQRQIVFKAPTHKNENDIQTISHRCEVVLLGISCTDDDFFCGGMYNSTGRILRTQTSPSGLGKYASIFNFIITEQLWSFYHSVQNTAFTTTSRPLNNPTITQRLTQNNIEGGC